ncbi:MAG TPA: transmembrane anchor protein [Hydrogenophaga sp.]|uniref:transmembrane anchor protein n=1 Tax=Hydrogenophaga sp. TaxID=1904254 RepID=UPI002CCDC428|nr:transmembrane anchor protein [Hydrogenophaga sp.]HMN94073.1 transmembrane anchor protein [Hydrogenophaga sp.]HMP09887.1 transmembrane anchor protein [Hydrogenophaga sp.]
MYNSEPPLRAELPTSRQLLRSTVIAAVSALVLLVTVVLPSEYAIDPTGVGRALGLTQMGEIKTRLAQEAAEDAAGASVVAVLAPAAESAAAPGSASASVVPASAEPAAGWRDEISFVLRPGEGTEIKLTMQTGEKATYAWTVEGGVVNYDTHGDGGGRSISYEKGRAVPSDEGELVAVFTGNHGWFWRNRGQADVTVVLRTGGAYSDIKRVK